MLYAAVHDEFTLEPELLWNPGGSLMPGTLTLGGGGDCSCDIHWGTVVDDGAICICEQQLCTGLLGLFCDRSAMDGKDKLSPRSTLLDPLW